MRVREKKRERRMHGGRKRRQVRYEDLTREKDTEMTEDMSEDLHDQRHEHLILCSTKSTETPTILCVCVCAHARKRFVYRHFIKTFTIKGEWKKKRIMMTMKSKDEENDKEKDI